MLWQNYYLYIIRHLMRNQSCSETLLRHFIIIWFSIKVLVNRTTSSMSSMHAHSNVVCQQQIPFRTQRICHTLFPSPRLIALSESAAHLEGMRMSYVRCRLWLLQMRTAGLASRLHTHNTQPTSWLISISSSRNSNSSFVMCQASLLHCSTPTCSHCCW